MKNGDRDMLVLKIHSTGEGGGGVIFTVTMGRLERFNRL